MIIKFDEKEPSQTSRAVQIWQILVSKAYNRQIVTYGMLADILGFKKGKAGGMGNLLGPIMYFCAQNDLPPLTAVVVNAETGLPGEGLIIHGDLNAERECVFNYNWYNLYPPSEKQFDEALQKAKAKGWKI
jgi:hypothetical protein